MKEATKRLWRVPLLLAVILALAAGMTALTGRVGIPQDKRTVVTTTYPLFVAAQNILGDSDTLAVENLTGAATGCLHDYQLSPANRITLQGAALVLMNGGGAEAFLTDTLAALPALPAVDTAAGLSLLTGCHSHDHPHDEPPHADDHAPNEHLWVSATRYAAQVDAATAALAALDPANAAAYAKNGAAYAARVRALGARLKATADKLASKNCVIFHDSLAYFADEAGLTVTASLHVGEEGGVAAHDLAAVQAALAADPHTLVLYDSQYSTRYTAVDRLVPAAHVLAVDTAVVGHGRASDWLDAMERNITNLEGAL